MGKILFWLGVFAAVFLVLKAVAVIQRKGTLNGVKNPPQTPSQSSSSENGEAPAPTQERLASLISCAKCGLHLPRQEAVERRGQYFCTAEHAD
jgi:uncharacterized protein